MQDFQQRVIEEKNQLDSKLLKLQGFVGSAVFNNLPQDEQYRLVRQEYLMKGYSEILSERIVAFKE